MTFRFIQGIILILTGKGDDHMNSDIDIFSRNLRLLRKDKGLTQSQLADQIGLTKQSIINYEKGTTFPTGNRLNKLLEALEVTAEQLLGDNVIQSNYEVKLLKTVHSKANFITGYEIQAQDNPTELRNYLFQQLSSLTDADLFDCINFIYDKKIQDAVNLHAREITDNTLSAQQSLNLDFDIPTEQIVD